MRLFRPTAWLALGYLAFVVYGSLVPLDFHPLPFEQALARFRQIPFLQLGIESRADWVANGVLYLPLGILTASALWPRNSRRWQLLVLALAYLTCLVVAVSVEFAQLFFPPRTVSQNDLIAEGIGSLLGVLLAPSLGPWLRRLRSRLSVGGGSLGQHLLEAYLVTYLLLCFFPYDVLLNGGELRSKLAGGLWSWGLVVGDGERLSIALLQLALEVALTLPFGWWWARRRPFAFQWQRALLPGLLLGVLIEGGQLFIASGVSQGASVLARLLGWAAGALLWQHAPRIKALGPALRRWWALVLAGYVLLLLFVNGWFHHSWQGQEQLEAQWKAMRLLPFYYHYYTTEAVALFSLGRVAIAYAPLGALGWALGWSGLRLGSVALGLSVAVESGKLFLSGTHPDPTNVLIAWASALTVALVLRLLGRSASPAGIEHTEAATAQALKPAARPAYFSGTVGAIVLLCLALLSLISFPNTHAVAPLLLVAALSVLSRPVTALVLVPACLPVFDLAPWTGRFFWDEFDLLLLVCSALVFLRVPPKVGDLARTRRLDALQIGFVVLGVSLLVSTLRGLFPWQGGELNTFGSYLHSANALRIFKGALLAWLFARMYERLESHGQARSRTLALGMYLGLAFCIGAVVWERLAFVSLFDFDSEHRVTGLISAMHKGGAYIECYLAVAMAFAMQGLASARSWRERSALAVLLAMGAYAMAVTFSRNGYAALVVAAAVVVMAALGQRSGGMPIRRRLAMALLVPGLLAAVLVPVLSTGFAKQRLERSSADFAVRLAHWQDALALSQQGPAARLFGVGVGRFPSEHYWRSAEVVHAGSYSLQAESGDNRFLRLGAGATLYLDQVVDLESLTGDHVLSARVRSNLPDASIAVSLCRKWGLSSADCRTARLQAGPEPGQWRRVEVTLSAPASEDKPWWRRPPLKLSLHTPDQQQTFDIDDVRLEGQPGTNALANSGFSEGLDHWFFSTDVDPPWHIHSLPVAVLFDQGWLGVAAWALVLLSALSLAWRSWRDGDVRVAGVVAALMAFLVSGSLNTLIDAPRFLFLLLMLTWLCRADRSDGQARDSGAVALSKEGARRTLAGVPHCQGISA